MKNVIWSLTDLCTPPGASSGAVMLLLINERKL